MLISPRFGKRIDVMQWRQLYFHVSPSIVAGTHRTGKEITVNQLEPPLKKGC